MICRRSGTGSASHSSSLRAQPRGWHDDSTLDHSRAAGYLARYATASASDLYVKSGPASHHLRRVRDAAAHYLKPVEYARLRRNPRNDGLGISDEDRERVGRRGPCQAPGARTRFHRSLPHQVAPLLRHVQRPRFVTDSPEPLPDHLEESITWTFISQGYHPLRMMELCRSNSGRRRAESPSVVRRSRDPAVVKLRPAAPSR